MTEMHVRPASVDDAAAITAIHCSHVDTWRQGGKGELRPYESLTLDERWLHGGPWMSVDSCTTHLARLQQAGWMVLVAEIEGEVIGEAEFVENREPEPYGPALHLSLLFVHRARQARGAGRALIERGVELAHERGCAALTTQPEPPAEPFYQRVGFVPWLRLGEWQARARDRALLVEPRPLSPPECPPAGLVLHVGRYQCGRQAWDDLPFPLDIAGLASLPWGAWQAALPDGSPLWLGLRAQPLELAQADGFAWSLPDVEWAPAIELLQTLAARLGFSAVDLLLEEPQGHELAAKMGLESQTSVVLWRREIEMNTRS